MARACRLMAALGLALALGACAQLAPKQEDLPPLVWPEELDVPARIAHVKAFSRPGEFGIAKGFFQRVAEVLFGATEERLVRPMGVVAVGGVVYVADPGVRGVHRFDPAGEKYELIGRSEEVGLPSPVALARGKAGEVYVTDSQLAQVLVIRPGAKEAVPLALPPMRQPTGIAVDPTTGRLIVVDTAEHKVNLFNADGTLHASFGQRGTGNGEFNFPTLIWRDGQGRLYVTDTLNYRIQIFDAEGKFIRQFGRIGDRGGDNMLQKGVATDSFGHVYIVDALFNAVQIFNQAGSLLLSVGSLGQDRGEFWLPVGIFIDENDQIYVADTYNQRIQILKYIGGPS